MIQDYSAVINSLPERDLPSFFGLPANIDRSSQRNISNQVISQLRVLKRSPSAGDKFDREAWCTELNPILAVWKKLNQVLYKRFIVTNSVYSAIHHNYYIEEVYVYWLKDRYTIFIVHAQGSKLITKQVSPPSDKSDSPVMAFIALERYNALQLVQTIHTSLAALNKVLRGSSLLTPAVQKMAGSLLKSEVSNFYQKLNK